MSRFSDYDEDERGLPAVFWQIDLRRALTSGRGQRILREVEEALLMMPEHRLAAGYIVDLGEWDEERDVRLPAGCCAVGAYAAYRQVKAGKTWEAALADLAESWGGETDCWDTQSLGMSVGLARTVAYELAYLNDEDFGRLSPEERWAAVLEWVRAQIVPAGVSV